MLIKSTQNKNKMTPGLRGNYSRIIKKYKAIGKGNVRLTESTIALIQPINATRSTYSFPVLENDSNNGLAPAPDEIRLNLNDEFIVGSIGLYLYGEQRESPEELFKSSRVYTYPPYEDTPAAIGLGNFYAGFLSVAVNKINYVDKWDVRKHEDWARTQQVDGAPGTLGATIPSKKMEDSGMYPCQPQFTLSGAKKNDIQISLPTAITPLPFTPFGANKGPEEYSVNKILVIFRGLLAQNGARFQN